MDKKLEGLLVAPITILNEDGRVDQDSEFAHREDLILNGNAKGIVDFGLNGMGQFLEDHHRTDSTEVDKRLREEFPELTLIAGIMGKDLDSSLALAQSIDYDLFDGILIGPSKDTKGDHLVLQLFELLGPILPEDKFAVAYNTGVLRYGFGTNTLGKIDDILNGRLLGVKNSKANSNLRANFKEGLPFQYLEGDDRKIADAKIKYQKMANISGSSNVLGFAKLIGIIYEAIDKNNIELAFEVQKYMRETFDQVLKRTRRYGGEQPIWNVMANARVPSINPYVLDPLKQVTDQAEELRSYVSKIEAKAVEFRSRLNS